MSKSALHHFMKTSSAEDRDTIMEMALESLKDLSLKDTRDREKLEALVTEAVNTAADHVRDEKQVTIQPQSIGSIIQTLIARVGGFGFLDELLPPSRNDLSEIALNQDGSLWIMPKGAEDFDLYKSAKELDQNEVWRVIETLLAPLGRSLSEATPSVNAKLPRGSLAPDFGGARVKVLHPAIAPGDGYPAFNIRLYEQRPVLPSQLVQWGVAPADVINDLVDAVRRKYRVLILGRTATGKTTVLSAISDGIPKKARVVKIEDPEEIWLQHPHVITLEARHSPPGSPVPDYTLADGVDDAMRMSPRWLIVGEVRTGDAALALFRAQMSDHPGLSTFHAEGPEKAVSRMAVIMFADVGVRMEAAKGIFAEAVDVIVQLGWLDNRRQITGIWEVEEELRGGNVNFRQIYQPGDASVQTINRKRV
jgi:pilus assembly protein CpaF